MTKAYQENEQVQVDKESQEMKPDGNFEFQYVMPGKYIARIITTVNTAGRRVRTL
jgi:hypothetical protein